MHVPPRIFRRVPYETAVRFEYDRFRGFVEEHSADLSLGGMFVKTGNALPVGTVMPIEFRLDDGYELIRGTGKVIWVRDRDEGPGRPAGMGLRFLELTAGSRELIFRVVERRVKEGEPTFDLDDAAAAARPAGESGAPGVDDLGELARPRWTTPPALESTDPGSAAAGVAGDDTAEAVGASDETSASSSPPASPPAEPWRVATPWKETPTAPRWVATDAPAGFAETADDDVAEALGSEHVFVPPPPAASPAARSAPPAARARRPGRRAAVAALLAVALGAAAWLGWDRWLGAGAAGADEPSPGSQVLLMPEEIDPPARGRGPGAEAAAEAEIEDGSGDGGPGGAATRAAGVPVAAADLPATPLPATPGPPPELASQVSSDSEEAAPSTGAARPGGAARVHDITWSDDGGRTDFLIWGDGPLDAGAVRHFTIGGGNPRLVLRIAGIDEPFARGRVEVGGALVERIRTGLHEDRGSSELHVVFDLTGGSVRLAGIEEVGGRLRVTVERAGR